MPAKRPIAHTLGSPLGRRAPSLQAASTNLADLVADGSDSTTHLDNLMGLNERGLLCSEGEQHDSLEQLSCGS